MAEKIGFTSVIANRGFRYLWLNQILVQLGDNALNFALIIWVYKLTDSNLAVSGLLLTIYLPVLLFGMFAGVFVDRYDRRKIIILVDILLAFAFVMFIFVKGSYPLILVNTFLRNSLTQFFLPAENSAIPLLVPKKQLILANALFSLTLYGSFMLGFASGGPILNSFGINAIFLGGAVLLIIASFTARHLPTIKTSGKPLKLKHPGLWEKIRALINLSLDETKETVHFIKGKVSLIAAIGLLSAVQGGIGILAVVTPSYLEKVLHIHATDASYFVIIPFGLGMITGIIILGRVSHRCSRRKLVVPAILVSGLLLILISAIPTLAHFFQSTELPLHLSRPRYFFRAPSLSLIFAGMAFLLGICLASIVIPSQTILQEKTTERNRGKVFAFLVVVMTALSAVTASLTGAFSDWFGVTPILFGIGVLIFGGGLVVAKPHLFFSENHLPFKITEFLGLGHWEGKCS